MVSKKLSYAEEGTSAIIGMIGLALIFASGLNLTGGVTGTLVGKNLATGFIGVALFIASLVLFILSFRKK